MASRFQRRLVGTIILVSIGVIFLPDVFDGKKLHYKEEITSIPLKPNIGTNVETYKILEPDSVKVSLPEAPIKVTKKTVSIKESTAKSEVKVQHRVIKEKNNYKDSAWLIQLMALKNADNAKKLVGDLQKRGYQAHSKVENGFTRVIIGPDISKSKLERQLVELRKITGAKGQLIKFKPLNP